MGLTNLLEDAKEAISELKKNRKFKAKNKERQQASDLLSALMKCRGRLETCKVEFNRVVKEQQRHIRKGRAEGMDVSIQEQTMWDAALGYLLVRDAIYSLESINTYDSVTHAYDMLDEAVKVMSGKGRPSEHLFLGAQQRRKEYEFLNSRSALKEKERILDTFFSKLEETGDIEACIKEAPGPDAYRADSVQAYAEGESTVDELLSRLGPETGEGGNPDPGSDQYKSKFDSSVPKF